jgi:hypothetical protein
MSDFLLGYILGIASVIEAVYLFRVKIVDIFIKKLTKDGRVNDLRNTSK